nr:DUF6701 domain-containing protein [Georgfuchsia toluolica]
MSNASRKSRAPSLIFFGLALLAVFGVINPAEATSVTAVNGLSCAGDRNTTNCTAGEFTVGISITNQPGSPTSCVAGDYVTLIGAVSLAGTNADRYNVGFFTGENGNDPKLAGTGQTCSVATFPTSPLPWFAKNVDACGDYTAAGVDNPVINNIKVLCAGDATGHLKVPYVLVYSQSAYTCTGPADVTNSSPSKCNAGTAVVDTATFVKGSVTVTKQTIPAGDAQSFAFTASGTSAVMTGDNSFSLMHNGSKQVRMGITDTNATLTITEAATTFWEPTATIACTKPDGSSAASFVTANGATRTITATLSNTNPNAKCTITNTKRSKITMVSNIGGRVNPTDQFTVTATGGGTLTDSAGDSISAPVAVATAGASTSASMTLWSQPAQTLTLTETAASGSLANYSVIYSCINATSGSATTMPSGSGSSFTLTPVAGDNITCTYQNNAQTASSFNAFETGTTAGAVTGHIYTKLAGTAFILDLVAINSGAQATSFSNNVKVELLANTGTAGSGYGADNCPTANSIIQTINSTAISGGRSSVSLSAVANAYRDVRVRISYPTSSPSVVVCSTDSFAIRPSAVTLVTSASAAAPSATAAPVIKAGNPFTLYAITSTGTNYAGILSLDNTKLTASGSVVGALLPASLTANPAPTPSNNASYTEVGYLYLAASAYRDSSYTSVDQSGDCISSSTDDSLASGQYGCVIGNNAAVSLGRFIPDHFTITLPSITAACSTGAAFSYFGQDGFKTTFTLTAQNAGNATTANYAGDGSSTSWAKLPLTTWGRRRHQRPAQVSALRRAPGFLRNPRGPALRQARPRRRRAIPIPGARAPQR